MAYESGVVYRVPLEDWYVVQPPIWEEHYPKGRNWLARIRQDPDVPGGLLRDWCERGKGRFKYNATSLMEGDTIEFGADRIWASGGNRSRVRSPSGCSSWLSSLACSVPTTLRST